MEEPQHPLKGSSLLPTAVASPGEAHSQPSHTTAPVDRRDEGGHRPGEVPELIPEQGKHQCLHSSLWEKPLRFEAILAFFPPAHGMLWALVVVINTFTQKLQINQEAE